MPSCTRERSYPRPQRPASTEHWLLLHVLSVLPQVRVRFASPLSYPDTELELWLYEWVEEGRPRLERLPDTGAPTMALLSNGRRRGIPDDAARVLVMKDSSRRERREALGRPCCTQPAAACAIMGICAVKMRRIPKANQLVPGCGRTAVFSPRLRRVPRG